MWKTVLCQDLYLIKAKQAEKGQFTAFTEELEMTLANEKAPVQQQTESTSEAY